MLLLDNQTAAVYINNLGGTVSAHAIKLARERWMWCIQRDILLTVQYLPGKELNVRGSHIVEGDEGPLGLDAEPLDISKSSETLSSPGS